jgi:hypothetical protein
MPRKNKESRAEYDKEKYQNNKEKIKEQTKLCSWSKWLEEVKKCIMLCANCHRTIHSKLDYNLTGY